MTNRERFHAVMNGRPADRSLAIEWASWWDKTVAQWESEGLPEGLSGEELQLHFGLDLNLQFWIQPLCGGHPDEPFHGAGLISTEEEYEALKRYLYPKDAVRKLEERFLRAQALHQSGEALVWYTLEGFFWFPRVLLGIENHLYSFYDNPELYHRICEDLLHWQMEVIDELAEYIQADFMTFAEDMSYNHGPMISKELFDEFMLPYYRRVIPYVKKHGTKVFVDSDGDVSKAIPWFIEAGIEGVLPLERQSGVDIAKLRADFPSLLMLGGFDKMCMFHGEEAIRREFERILPIIRSGRYIQSMDHQTPPGTTLENYRIYVRLLKEYCIFAENSR
jgi:hypothetical protein